MTVSSACERVKPGPKRRGESKRNSPDWVAFTAFMTPEDRDELQNIIHMVKLTGGSGPADQSEALRDALKPYLAKMRKQLKAKLLETV